MMLTRTSIDLSQIESELARIPDDEDLFTSLETDCSLKFDRRLRNRIADSLWAFCLSRLMYDEFLGYSKERRESAGRITSAVENLIKVLEQESSNKKRCPNGFGSEYDHFLWLLRKEQKLYINEFGAGASAIELIAQAASELRAASKVYNKKSTAKKRTNLWNYLGEVYTAAGGTVAVTYNPQTESIESKFIDFTKSILERCPTPLRDFALSGIEEDIRKWHRSRRKGEIVVDKGLPYTLKSLRR